MRGGSVVSVWRGLMREVATLRHSSAAGCASTRLRHDLFILTRMAASLLVIAAAPLGLAAWGAPPVWAIGAFFWLMAPMAAALVASRTGDLTRAATVSSLGFLGLAATLGAACAPAGFVVAVLAPFEAAFALDAAIIAALGVVAAAGIVIAELAATQPALVSSTLEFCVLAAAPAVLYAAALAAAAAWVEAARVQKDDAVATRRRALAQAAGDLVLDLDRAGNVLDAGLEIEGLFGLRVRDFSGRGLFERVHVGDRPTFLRAVADAAAASDVVSATMRLRRAGVASPHGDFEEPVFAWVELRARALGDSGAGVVAVIRDISIRKAREDEAEAVRREAARTSAWKDRFLANVSHELRTPLNAIIGFSEMLSSVELSPREPAKQREYASIINTSGQHLLSVVNTILDMSKIEAGSFDILAEPFELAPLIDACCDMMQLKAEQKQVSLKQDYPLRLDDIVADKRACKQIIINLLSNAVKFTLPRGRITVSVRQDGNCVLIIVADTGVGIPVRDLPRLGDPFFQSRDQLDRPFEGTGLGLSVVRGLVGLHGGSIRIESGAGEGTSVTVRLPLDCRRGARNGGGATIESIARHGRLAPPLLEPHMVANRA